MTLGDEYENEKKVELAHTKPHEGTSSRHSMWSLSSGGSESKATFPAQALLPGISDFARSQASENELLSSGLAAQESRQSLSLAESPPIARVSPQALITNCRQSRPSTTLTPSAEPHHPPLPVETPSHSPDDHGDTVIIMTLQNNLW